MQICRSAHAVIWIIHPSLPFPSHPFPSLVKMWSKAAWAHPGQKLCDATLHAEVGVWICRRQEGCLLVQRCQPSRDELGLGLVGDRWCTAAHVERAVDGCCNSCLHRQAQISKGVPGSQWLSPCRDSVRQNSCLHRQTQSLMAYFITAFHVGRAVDDGCSGLSLHRQPLFTSRQS